MEVKPGYKQTEVGVIPNEWEDPRLDSLGDGKAPPIKAGPFGSSLTKDQYVPEGFKIYGQEQVISGDHLFGNYFISLKKYRELETCAVHPGDVLLSLVGTVGRLLEVPEGAPPGIINPRLIRFTFDRERVLSQFFTYVFASSIVQSLLARQAQGGTMGVLNAGVLRPFRLPLPPLPEQRAIATALSDVDGLLGGLDRLIAKKRDLKQAAMQQLLTGQTRLPGFHGEWEVKRLDEIADVIDPHPSHRAPDEVSNGVPFVGIGDLDEDGNLVGLKLRYVDRAVLLEHAARYNLDDQLIGLGRVASIGKVVCLKPLPEGFAISPTLGVIRGRIVQRGYLLYALRSKFITEQFTRIMSGSTRSSVGMEVLRKLNVLLPPTTEEQTAIAEVLSEMDGELAVLEQRREKTRALKQAMMQELLTGRIRLV